MCWLSPSTYSLLIWELLFLFRGDYVHKKFEHFLQNVFKGSRRWARAENSPCYTSIAQHQQTLFSGNVAGVKHLPRKILSLWMIELHKGELFLTEAHRSSSVRKKQFGDSQWKEKKLNCKGGNSLVGNTAQHSSWKNLYGGGKLRSKVLSLSLLQTFHLLTFVNKPFFSLQCTLWYFSSTQKNALASEQSTPVPERQEAQGIFQVGRWKKRLKKIKIEETVLWKTVVDCDQYTPGHPKWFELGLVLYWWNSPFPVKFPCSLQRMVTATQKLLPYFCLWKQEQQCNNEGFWILCKWLRLVASSIHRKEVFLLSMNFSKDSLLPPMCKISISPRSPLENLSQASACFKNHKNAFPGVFQLVFLSGCSEANSGITSLWCACRIM